LELDLDFHFEQPTTNVTIYPNPSRLFQISISGFMDERWAWTVVRVYDERGGLVLDQGFSGRNFVLDMTGKATGHYTIQLIRNSGFRAIHAVMVH
jgi:hypothetical protein